MLVRVGRGRSRRSQPGTLIGVGPGLRGLARTPTSCGLSVDKQHLLRLLTHASGLNRQLQSDRQPLREEVSEQKPLPAPATREDIVVALNEDLPERGLYRVQVGKVVEDLGPGVLIPL